MSADREERLATLFSRVAPLSSRERQATLDEVREGDPQLHRELQALLAADEVPSPLDDCITLEDLAWATSDDEDASGTSTASEAAEGGASRGHPSDQRIGTYVLLRQLGAGGMGEVYLAQQSEPVQRQVALKIIRRGMDSAEVLARFDAERQALALLESPHVARIVDVGTSEDGRAFFALEHVDGVPITQFCDEQALDLRARLQLFLQVCRGIEEAHQRGIIHRDIKPMNILVATDRPQPVVKIIDFGIAKMTQHAAGHTVQGMVLGTPEYMSPEQAASGGRDIDTRSDIYSAGLVLYEMLVGDVPYDRAALRQASTLDALQQVVTRAVPRPSERVTAGDATKAHAAVALQRALRGELDWICLRALERDRTRRYQSIGELAADIRRYLDGETVLARPPSVGYRMRKFARRHLGAVVTTAIVACVLLGAAIVSSTFYFREQAAHRGSQSSAQRAEAAQKQSERAAEFLRRVLVEMNAVGPSGEPATLEGAIGLALAELEAAGLTAAEAAGAKYSVATILNDMKFRSMAKLAYESALEDFATAGDADVFEHASCLLELAALRTRFVRDDTATRNLTHQALELIGDTPEAYEAVGIQLKAVEVLLRSQESAQAQALLRRTLATFRAQPFLEHQPEAARQQHDALLTMARLLQKQGESQEAFDLLLESDRVALRAGFTTALDRLRALRRQAQLAMQMQRYALAVASFDSTLQLLQRLRGNRARYLARDEGRRALALAYMERGEEAAERLDDVVARCEDDPVCASAYGGDLEWTRGEVHRLRRAWTDALRSYDNARSHYDARWADGGSPWHARLAASRALVPGEFENTPARTMPVAALVSADPHNQAFLYGRLTSSWGDEYEGYLRWGTEELFWDDLFQAMKEVMPFLPRNQPEVTDVRQGSADSSIARWKVRTGFELGSWSRMMIARFGDIGAIHVLGEDRARLLMKSGEELEVCGATNDLNSVIHVQDIELGELSVEWRRIETIEFLPAPGGLPAPARRLHGTVETLHGVYSGPVQWDKQESLGSDLLNAMSDNAEVAIEMGRIVSIERLSAQHCEVVLQDGSTLSLYGANDVDNNNRGITVEDPRFGRVSIPWTQFVRLRFDTPVGSGPGYTAYGETRALRGRVVDVDGNVMRGEIVFDLDESQTWEMLSGTSHEIEFDIPFQSVASIAPSGESSRVVLRNGERVELRGGQDVAPRNAGALVAPNADWDKPQYIAWARIARIEFEE